MEVFPGIPHSIIKTPYPDFSTLLNLNQLQQHQGNFKNKSYTGCDLTVKKGWIRNAYLHYRAQGLRRKAEGLPESLDVEQHQTAL